MRKVILMLSNSLYNISKYLLILISASLTVIVIVQVISRTLFNFSFVWADEIGRYLMVWLAFVGVSVAFRDNEMAAMDLLANKVGKYKVVYQIILQLIILFFGILSFIYGLKVCIDPSVRLQSSPSINLSMFWVYVSIPIGAVLMVVHSINNIFQSLDEVNMSINSGHRQLSSSKNKAS